jgi:hypothetical protein
MCVVVCLVSVIAFRAGAASVESAVRRQLPSAIRREVAHIQDLRTARDNALSVIAAHLSDVAVVRADIIRQLRDQESMLADMSDAVRKLDTVEINSRLQLLAADIRIARESAKGFVNALDVAKILPEESGGRSPTETLIKAMRDAAQNSVSTKLGMFSTRLEMQDKILDSMQKRQIDDKATLIDIRKALLPVGSIFVYPGSMRDIGDKYLPCDGQEIKQSEYPELYRLLSETHPGCFVVTSGVCKLPKLLHPQAGQVGDCTDRMLFVIRAKL